MSMTQQQAKQLGALIAKARAGRGLSLRDLAAELDLHRSWLGYLEQGKFLDPAPDRLARVADALGIEPARIDRLTHGAVAQSLPGIGTYFRAKYDLTPEEVAKIEAYVKRLRRAA